MAPVDSRNGITDPLNLAYERFVKRQATLMLLSNHCNTDPNDELAKALGITFAGIPKGRVTGFAPRSITAGVAGVPYFIGAVATAFDPYEVEILGGVNDTLATMGLLHSKTAKICFCGDTNLLQGVPQPLVDNLIEWGFD